MSGLNFLLFMGSMRQGRNCERVTKLVQHIVESQSATATVIDPAELKLDLIGQPLHFRPDPSTAPEVLLKTNELIRKADGYIFISPEYNRVIGPALLNTTDHFPPNSYAYRPSAIITYSVGPTGGAMAAAQLRAHVGELGTVSIGRMVLIGGCTSVINEQGETKDEKLIGQLTKQVEQLIWYANALKEFKNKNPVPT